MVNMKVIRSKESLLKLPMLINGTNKSRAVEQKVTWLSSVNPSEMRWILAQCGRVRGCMCCCLRKSQMVSMMLFILVGSLWASVLRLNTPAAVISDGVQIAIAPQFDAASGFSECQESE